jgi:hypothetical protein
LQPIDKFGGFAVFMQQHSYPTCAHCGHQMIILVCMEQLCWRMDKGNVTSETSS